MMPSPTSLSPLHHETVKVGAQLAEVAGWQVAMSYTPTEEEVTAAESSVVLIDTSSSSKIMVEGVDAATIIKARWDAVPNPIGQGIVVDSGYVYRLRNDQFFVHLPTGSGEEVQNTLNRLVSKTGKRVTVTDITHGLADLILAGPESPVLLSRLCSLDFHPDHFPSGTAKQSSVAKTRQLILHQLIKNRDKPPLPAYSLIGGRSLAVYLWTVILEAGRDLAIRPAGLAALQELAVGVRSSE